MDRKKYRTRRRINSFAKANKMTVAKSAALLTAENKIMAALGGLKRERAIKVLRAVAILLED